MKPAGKLSLRQMLLAGALVATLLATWWASQVDEAGVAVPPPRRAQEMPPPAAAGSAARPPGRPPWPARGAELIAEPPPPPTVMATPPAPAEAAAPPLPFRYVGGFDEPGQRYAVLLVGPEVATVRAGERVGEQYRVARITPTRIEFIHLPTHQRQALEIADYDQQQ